LRNFNESVVLLCAAITALDFFYIPYETETGPLSVYIVPFGLLVVFIWSFLTSKKSTGFALYKILLGYCLYAAGFVGVLVPTLTLITWLFSESMSFSQAFTVYGYAILYQLSAGAVFGVVGYFAFNRLDKLYAST